MGETSANQQAERANPGWREARVRLRRILARTTLSQRFLATATVVVSLAVLLIGHLTVMRLEHSITTGVALTAASSIDALLSHELRTVNLDRPLSDRERSQLDEVFRIGSDAETTRLMQIRLFDLAGTPRYEATDAFESDPLDPVDLARVAERAELVAAIVDVGIREVGPVPSLPVKVLELLSPVHNPAGDPAGVAQVYLSARSLVDILDEARLQAWLTVGGIGAAVILVLFQLVDAWSRTITFQRRRLEQNLVRSRRLSLENKRLHAASEQLRVDAGIANENLLGKVGSDIHDGPIQLLTLVILRLGKGRGTEGQGSEQAATQKLAMEAMEELRNISGGLVLPELADLKLADVLALAVSRHQDITGTMVVLTTKNLDHEFPVDVRVCCYRVVQEALMNAYRHGSAAEQSVDGTAEADLLTLTISNAVRELPGRQQGTGGRPGGLGLKGMRFRVESLGGSLEVAVGPERASVTAKIPYRA